MARYARSFLMLVGCFAVLGAFSTVAVIPVSIGFVCASAVLFAASYLAWDGRWRPALASLAVALATLTALESTPALLPLDNFAQVEAVKFIVYAASLLPALVVAVAVIRRSVVARSMSPLDGVALLALGAAASLWVAGYFLARFRIVPGFSGRSVGEAFVNAVLVVWPVLLVAMLIVASVSTVASRLTKASPDR